MDKLTSIDDLKQKVQQFCEESSSTMRKILQSALLRSRPNQLSKYFRVVPRFAGLPLSRLSAFFDASLSHFRIM